MHINKQTSTGSKEISTVMQGTVEGGFMGRTNKLVDGCYSFWQGGLFPLLQKLMPDYLAQTSIPCMPSSSSSDASATTGSSCGQEEVSGGEADLAVSEEAVMQIEGRDPALQALDDLHRTKVALQINSSQLAPSMPVSLHGLKAGIACCRP